jgi:hypothetical protein
MMITLAAAAQRFANARQEAKRAARAVEAWESFCGPDIWAEGRPADHAKLRRLADANRELEAAFNALVRATAEGISLGIM